MDDPTHAFLRWLRTTRTKILWLIVLVLLIGSVLQSHSGLSNPDAQSAHAAVVSGHFGEGSACVRSACSCCGMAMSALFRL